MRESFTNNPGIFLSDDVKGLKEENKFKLKDLSNQVKEAEVHPALAEMLGDVAFKPKATVPLKVETLLGDFRGDLNLVDIALTGNMDVFAHNIETVQRLNSTIRDRRANYTQSMSVLEHVAKNNDARKAAGLNEIITKTSIIVGLGETDAEIEQTLRDLFDAGVRAVTLGQYLKPAWNKMAVARYATEDEFEGYGRYARELGFEMVASGPMVRSSYRAGELFLSRLIDKKNMPAGGSANTINIDAKQSNRNPVVNTRHVET